MFLLFCLESLKAHSRRARGEAGSQVPRDAFLEGALQGGTKTQRAMQTKQNPAEPQGAGLLSLAVLERERAGKGICTATVAQDLGQQYSDDRGKSAAWRVPGARGRSSKAPRSPEGRRAYPLGRFPAAQSGRRYRSGRDLPNQFVALDQKPKSHVVVGSEIGDDLDERLSGGLTKLNVATLTQGWGGTGASTPVLIAAPRAERTGEPLHCRTRFLRPCLPNWRYQGRLEKLRMSL